MNSCETVRSEPPQASIATCKVAPSHLLRAASLRWTLRPAAIDTSTHQQIQPYLRNLPGVVANSTPNEPKCRSAANMLKRAIPARGVVPGEAPRSAAGGGNGNEAAALDVPSSPFPRRRYSPSCRRAVNLQNPALAEREQLRRRITHFSQLLDQGLGVQAPLLLLPPISHHS